MAQRKSVLTTFEAAKLCNVSYNTIKNWIKRDLLSAYRTAGGHLRIRYEELERFCREHSIPISDEGVSLTRRVLVVDDEESIREALVEALAQYPERLEVHTAADGFEAGALLENLKPDLVVLDIVMPGLDGFKVCQRIRRSQSTKHTRILVLTGFPSEQNIQRITEMGADDCLAKPIDRKVLFDAVGKLLKPKGAVRRQGKRLWRKSS
jgi:excisionase family DNA binding protein